MLNEMQMLHLPLKLCHSAMDETSNGSKVFYLQMASGAIWWPNLKLMPVAPSGGQLVNSCN